MVPTPRLVLVAFLLGPEVLAFYPPEEFENGYGPVDGVHPGEEFLTFKQNLQQAKEMRPRIIPSRLFPGQGRNAENPFDSYEEFLTFKQKLQQAKKMRPRILPSRLFPGQGRYVKNPFDPYEEYNPRRRRRPLVKYPFGFPRPPVVTFPHPVIPLAPYPLFNPDPLRYLDKYRIPKPAHSSKALPKPLITNVQFQRKPDDAGYDEDSQGDVSDPALRSEDIDKVDPLPNCTQSVDENREKVNSGPPVTPSQNPSGQQFLGNPPLYPDGMQILKHKPSQEFPTVVTADQHYDSSSNQIPVFGDSEGGKYSDSFPEYYYTDLIQNTPSLTSSSKGPLPHKSFEKHLPKNTPFSEGRYSPWQYPGYDYDVFIESLPMQGGRDDRGTLCGPNDDVYIASIPFTNSGFLCRSPGGTVSGSSSGWRDDVRPSPGSQHQSSVKPWPQTFPSDLKELGPLLEHHYRQFIEHIPTSGNMISKDREYVRQMLEHHYRQFLKHIPTTVAISKNLADKMSELERYYRQFLKHVPALEKVSEMGGGKLPVIEHYYQHNVDRVPTSEKISKGKGITAGLEPHYEYIIKNFPTSGASSKDQEKNTGQGYTQLVKHVSSSQQLSDGREYAIPDSHYQYFIKKTPMSETSSKWQYDRELLPGTKYDIVIGSIDPSVHISKIGDQYQYQEVMKQGRQYMSGPVHMETLYSGGQNGLGSLLETHNFSKIGPVTGISSVAGGGTVLLPGPFSGETPSLVYYEGGRVLEQVGYVPRFPARPLQGSQYYEEAVVKPSPGASRPEGGPGGDGEGSGDLHPKAISFPVVEVSASRKISPPLTTSPALANSRRSSGPLDFRDFGRSPPRMGPLAGPHRQPYPINNPFFSPNRFVTSPWGKIKYPYPRWHHPAGLPI